MTTRSTKYASLNYDANFFYHYENRKVVAMSVSGKDLPVNGFVSKEQFVQLLEMVQNREGIRYNVNENYVADNGVEFYYESKKVEPKEINVPRKISEAIAKKVSKGTYRMTYSEYGYNYLPEIF